MFSWRSWWQCITLCLWLEMWGLERLRYLPTYTAWFVSHFVKKIAMVLAENVVLSLLLWAAV